MHKVCTQAAQHVLACCAKTQKQILLSTAGIGLKGFEGKLTPLGVMKVIHETHP